MGRSGCGKSFLCRRLQKIWPRRVIIDSLNEYREEREKFFDFETITERLIEIHERGETEFCLVFQFDPEREDKNLVLNELIRVIYKAGNILLVIEEVQLYSSPHFLPHWLENALLTGRHQNLGLMFTSQRPGLVNKTIVSQCAHIFCGNLIDQNDIKYVSGFLNQESTKLINLKKTEFVYRNPSGIFNIKNSD